MKAKVGDTILLNSNYVSFIGSPGLVGVVSEVHQESVSAVFDYKKIDFITEVEFEIVDTDNPTLTHFDKFGIVDGGYIGREGYVDNIVMEHVHWYDASSNLYHVNPVDDFIKLKAPTPAFNWMDLVISKESCIEKGKMFVVKRRTEEEFFMIETEDNETIISHSCHLVSFHTNDMVFNQKDKVIILDGYSVTDYLSGKIGLYEKPAQTVGYSYVEIEGKRFCIKTEFIRKIKETKQEESGYRIDMFGFKTNDKNWDKWLI